MGDHFSGKFFPSLKGGWNDFFTPNFLFTIRLHIGSRLRVRNFFEIGFEFAEIFDILYSIFWSRGVWDTAGSKFFFRFSKIFFLEIVTILKGNSFLYLLLWHCLFKVFYGHLYFLSPYPRCLIWTRGVWDTAGTVPAVSQTPRVRYPRCLRHRG